MLPQACKNSLLGMYYLASWPLRRRETARLTAEGAAPVLALFYHRVADDNLNDWTISTEMFQEQIDWVRQRYDFISLADAQQRIASGVNREPAVCLTFDDGYAENCDIALPWLIEQGVPTTYFVATNHVLRGEPFPHDTAAGTPLPVNTPEQLRDLAAGGVEIGAHTRSHLDLGPVVDEQLLYEEIVGSKRDLEQLLDRPVRYFAFPYGLPENLSEAAFRTAFGAGYWGVCSAYGGYNLPGDDPFHIQRFHGDTNWSQFRNWMTLDPRKLHGVERFRARDCRLWF